MGCASSKQKRCRHCRAPYSPVPRSYSMHVVHPPQDKGDSYHVVALTSTTLGSLALDSSSDIRTNINSALDIVAAIGNDEDCKNDQCNGGSLIDKEIKSKEFSMGLIEAKSWSNMIQEKIPKIIPRTPVRTPPGEPETINTWELMAGLEEDEDHLHLPHRFRSFSFDVSHDPTPVVEESPKLNNHTKPIWLQLAEEEDPNSDSNSPEFDPQVISTFRKSLQELSPSHPFYLNPDEHNNRSKAKNKDKVVMYFTSLRGIRKTYEDCCNVRIILKGLGVRVDERDVSMHSGFKEELKHLLGEWFSNGGLGLPRVFIGTKYIGGAEEIRRLHEEGKLEIVLQDCEKLEDDGDLAVEACQACGDIRFVPCETCSGSCKIYYERDDDAENDVEGDEEGEFGFQRCPDCNENGLIRCRICCY